MSTYTNTQTSPPQVEIQRPPGQTLTDEELREQEEIAWREEALNRWIMEQCRHEALKEKERARQEQPHAAGSHDQPLDTGKEAASRQKRKTKRVRQVAKTEDDQDYSYDVTVTDDDSMEIDSIAESETFRRLPQEQQIEAVAQVQAKVGSKFARELGATDLTEPGVVEAGIVEGARRTVARFGSEPNVPPLYGRAVTT